MEFKFVQEIYPEANQRELAKIEKAEAKKAAKKSQ